VIAEHNLAGLNGVFYLYPVGININAALNTANTVVVPSVCKPTVSIYSYLGQNATWGVYQATLTAGSNSFTLGSQIASSCSTTSAAGSSCSISATSNVSAGTVVTIQGNNTGSAATAPVYTAFSCQ